MRCLDHKKFIERHRAVTGVRSERFSLMLPVIVDGLKLDLIEDCRNKGAGNFHFL
jgi:hypothetical protein